MILGDTKRECLSCRKMLPYDNFDYDWSIKDFWENGEEDERDFCKPCYLKSIQDQEDGRVRHSKELLIEKRINHNLKVICGDAPRCPKCDSRRGCGCYSTDSDGWCRGYQI